MLLYLVVPLPMKSKVHLVTCIHMLAGGWNFSIRVQHARQQFYFRNGIRVTPLLTMCKGSLIILSANQATQRAHFWMSGLHVNVLLEADWYESEIRLLAIRYTMTHLSVWAQRLPLGRSGGWLAVGRLKVTTSVSTIGDDCLFCLYIILHYGFEYVYAIFRAQHVDSLENLLRNNVDVYVAISC